MINQRKSLDKDHILSFPFINNFQGTAKGNRTTQTKKKTLKPVGSTSTIKNSPLYIIWIIITGLNSRGFHRPIVEHTPIAIQKAPIIFIESLLSYACENTSCGALDVANRATLPTTPVTRILQTNITRINMKEGCLAVAAVSMLLITVGELFIILLVEQMDGNLRLSIKK